jgi:hypothetical protein
MQAQQTMIVNFDRCHDLLRRDLLETGAAYELEGVCWIDSSMIDPERDLRYAKWTVIQKDGYTNWPVVVIENDDSVGMLVNFAWNTEDRQLLFDWSADGRDDPGSGVYDPPLNPGDYIRSETRPRAIFTAMVVGAVRCAAHPGCRTAAMWIGKRAIQAGLFLAGGIITDMSTKVFNSRVDTSFLTDPRDNAADQSSLSGSSSSGNSQSTIVTGQTGSVEFIEIPTPNPKKKKAVVIYRDSNGNVIGKHEYVL